MHSRCFKVTFFIPGATNLKEKRMVVRSVKERIRAKFNVSAVECGGNDKWQICSMGFALAAISESLAEQGMQDIMDFLFNDGRIEISDVENY